MQYFMFALFTISTAIHLYASLKKNQKIRNISKPFILLSLLGFYLASTQNIILTVVLALIFSWLGDLWLIPKDVKYFTIGGILFMVSHFFFILSYAKDITFTTVPFISILTLSVFFVVTVIFIFSKLRSFLPKPLFYPMFLYLLINGSMNCFAVFRMICSPTLSTIITCIGAILFFISDSSLFFVRFNKNGRLQTHFLVMLTYSIGEFLIVLGLI